MITRINVLYCVTFCEDQTIDKELAKHNYESATIKL